MPPALTASQPRYGLARVLSKRGLCSRTEAARWIVAGRVSVGGRVIRDPEHPTRLDAADIRIDTQPDRARAHRYLVLNKPRGLLVTARDERGRDTVYRCFDGDVGGDVLGWIAPVGRLDKASEGLLLFSSDAAWAARITAPDTGPRKRYHVQIDAQPTPAQLAALTAGVDEGGERLCAAAARLLRAGTRNAWLEIALDGGRNRQIRRMLAALELSVLRLVRVAIGPLTLGDLAKGHWRALDDAEAEALAPRTPERRSPGRAEGEPRSR